MKSRKLNISKGLIVIIVIIAVFVISIFAIAGLSIFNNYTPSNNFATSSQNVVRDDFYEEASADDSQSEKIVITSDINMQTDKFDSVSESIRNQVKLKNGYIQHFWYGNHSKDIEFRRVSAMTIMVPSDEYESMLSYLEFLGKITSTSTTTTLLTSEYYDIEKKLQTKKLEEQKILELMSKTTRIEDLINLEEMLSEARSFIASYESQISDIDIFSYYTTINLYLNEVTTSEMLGSTSTLFERSKNSFVVSIEITKQIFENLLIFIAFISLPVLIICIAVFILRFILKK